MTTQQSAENPGPRWGHTFVYDPIRDNVLLFGGARERGTFLNDTWTWDGNSWTHHQIPSPPHRGFAAATFHADQGTVLLHGGRSNERTTNSDTWEWDGTNWKELEAKSPHQCDHHQIVYLEHEKKVMAFGGWTGEDVSGDTWAWDGAWQQITAEGPRKRAAFGMTYDSSQERVVLFGGLWIDGQYADLWQWKNQAWEQLGGPYDNSSLDHHAMTYDAKYQQIVVFGGKNYRYVLSSKTRAIEKNTITQLSSEGPSPRHSIGLTYDTKRNKVLLYGGKEYQGDEQLALSDLWIWNGVAWTQH
jgi:hypothetical protein